MSYRIGSGEGYYGDDVLRALPMLEAGAVDALAFEALSELTLAILRRQTQRDPNLGYTRDLELIARKLLPLALAQGVPIVTNGGGLNPRGGANAIASIARELDLAALRIAVVTGDDVLDRVASIEGLDAADTPALSANVYLGAAPIVEALQRGANVVVTGRVADPSLYLAL
ncbi:MAG: acyclic terpene utilization AtuA family protein, partial [Candidatus Eremiobacteraeota bacterium]|nr:acyclic terpene utilization AtuA family protein [Candidatus Eremiobacteraeota bacterium]